MTRERPSEMEKEQWELLEDLMNHHSFQLGISEGCYMYSTFSPQNNKDALYSRRLFMTGYLKHINPTRKSGQEKWSPIYVLSQKTFEEFGLKR